MSATTLCGFCESLPVRAPGHAVKTIRCPLCKTDLGVTASGDKFLISEDAAEPPAMPHRNRLLAFFANPFRRSKQSADAAG